MTIIWDELSVDNIRTSNLNARRTPGHLYDFWEQPRCNAEHITSCCLAAGPQLSIYSPGPDRRRIFVARIAIFTVDEGYHVLFAPSINPLYPSQTQK